MSLQLLRALAFDGPLRGLLRDPPGLLSNSDLVTGFHVSFDSWYLARATRRSFYPSAPWLDRDSLLKQLDEATRRPASPGGDAEWSIRCKEMGYRYGAKPVVVTIDYGAKADQKWLYELPREYENFPIRYRHSPPARAQLSAGSGISAGNKGTCGGFLEDKSTSQAFAITCAHVAGTSSHVDEIDKSGHVLGGIGKVVAAILPNASVSACNQHASPGSGVDAALIELSSGTTVTAAPALTVRAIPAIDQDDLIVFDGYKSGPVQARVGAATIWKRIAVGNQDYCFGDLFTLTHRKPIYLSQAISQGGDSGAWILEDPSSISASTGWLGMLIAGDQNQSQSLACYAEHVFSWAQTINSNLVLPP